MLHSLPTWVFPLILAAVAALVGWMFTQRQTAEPNSLVSRILFMVAIGCVIIGIATWWLSRTV
jgi:hypothetical protein